MTPMLVDCHRDAPARPPDWRWRLAEAIHSGLLLPSGRGLDRWTQRAIQFLGDHVADKGDASIGRSDCMDPAILEAFEIRFSAEPRQRSVLEARVLAGQTAPAIAELCSLTADVVEAFEALHYNVHDRLKAADFITGVVIGIVPHDGLATTDALLKAFAYGYGEHVLDAVLAVLDAEQSAVGGARNAASVDVKPIKMAMAARTLPVNEKTAPGLIRLQARLLEFERGAAADVFVNRPIRATVEPWPTPAIGGGAGRPVRAVSVDLVSATLAEPIREGPGDCAGAIIVAFPELNPGDLAAPVRRTA